ncbi:MAG: cobalt transporter CbiM [Deltaproteobacteria bacterium]|nr:cobalt transporter CbiM [Deltaproteobacteria bacterium]
MHISEGVLAAPVLLAGAALGLAGTAAGLKKLDYDRIPQVALLAAASFVASFIHVPIGPASVHLVLNGILGVMLGWVAFPAILISLFLQAIMFQFGGLTVLGVTTCNLALPAVLGYYAFGPGIRSSKPRVSAICSFSCGFVAVLLSSLAVAGCLVLTGDSFWAGAKMIVMAHIPVMFIEGFITLGCVRFLKKVKPEMLEVVYGRR